MKQVKKIISFILTSIFCFYGIGMISSCDNRRNESISSDVFYTLQETYDEGILTNIEVGVIAERHNTGELATPTEEIATELKTAYAKEYPRENFAFQDVVIKEFIGEFSGCYAVIIAYKDEDASAETWIETVAEIEIFYKDGFSILIYKAY